VELIFHNDNSDGSLGFLVCLFSLETQFWVSGEQVSSGMHLQHFLYENIEILLRSFDSPQLNQALLRLCS